MKEIWAFMVMSIRTGAQVPERTECSSSLCCLFLKQLLAAGKSSRVMSRAKRRPKTDDVKSRSGVIFLDSGQGRSGFKDRGGR